MSTEITLSIFNSVFFFCLGMIFGWFVRTQFEHSESKLSQSMLVMVVVTLVWSVSVISEITNPSYKSPVYVHGLMGLIAGYFFKRGLDK